ncbi:MAG: methionine adenosyltransferase [Erysipelotrichaceae bacterium]|nr:methionine adenosyltransferase [Erysipelotrichaceae bacterium]
MRIFTTEQVSKYHPDKYADQISDAVLAECLRQDKNAHVACECLCKDKTVVIAGEITTTAVIDYEAIIRRVAKKLNYEVEKIINLISKQSPEINGAVSKEELCAGDQGIMFGYAYNDTYSYLPIGFDLANHIIHRLEKDTEQNAHTILKGDAKTQVSVDLDTDEVKTILVSVCHKEGLTLEEVKKYVKDLLAELVEDGVELIINPAGTWTIGGPIADCGLTGRKIVCDQYGGYCAVGGGAFSGKDPSKVDRSATYMARKIAVDLVKKFDLKTCEVQLSYMIGRKDPMSVEFEYTLKNQEYSILPELQKDILAVYDLSPNGIIKALDLLNADYENFAEGNHMEKIK